MERHQSGRFEVHLFRLLQATMLQSKRAGQYQSARVRCILQQTINYTLLSFALDYPSGFRIKFN